MDTLRFPLRFVQGEVQKLTEGTADYYAQILALTAQIEPGELPLTPEFGVEDPAFNTDARNQLALTAAYFVPEIKIESLTLAENNVGQSDIKITFSIRS